MIPKFCALRDKGETAAYNIGEQDMDLEFYLDIRKETLSDYENYSAIAYSSCTKSCQFQILVWSLLFVDIFPCLIDEVVQI